MSKQGSFTENMLRGLSMALCSLSIGVSAQSNTLTVNIGQANYKIERAIYGHLWENLGRDIYNGLYVGTNSSVPNTDGFRKDIIQAFVEEGMPCLEWPGGCAVWNYNWRNGIGPVASRPGGDMVNGVGTAEYFKLCKMINSIPYITCNLRGATVAENVAWMNYIDTVPEWKNTLKYWKIGNEEFGGCGGTGNTVNDFITRYLPQVNAIPASWVGKIMRIAEGGTDPSWTSTVLDQCKGKLDAISYHYYSVDWGNKGSSTTFDESLYYKQLQSAWNVDAKLKGFETVLDSKDPQNTIGIMVDEWGAWYDAVPGMGALYQQSSVRDAVLAVMSLNVFNNHCKRVKMALAAQAVNVLAASILTQTSPGTAMVKTPTYYVLKMLRPHQNAKMIPVTLTCGNVSNIPILSASASIDSANTLHISLGNHHSTAQQTLAITLTGLPTGSAAYSKITGQIVNGPSFSSYNDFNKPETVTLQDFPSSNYTLSGTKLTVTLPAHSAVMLTLASSTGVVSRIADRVLEKVSIKTAIKGKIIVSTAGIRNIPVRLTLYTAEGRRIAEMITTAGPAGIEWRPGIHGVGAGVYIIKVQGGGILESQPIMYSR